MATDETKELTAREASFVEQYVIDNNATQAAIRAGYAPTHATSQGYMLLQKPHVQAAIDELKEKISATINLTVERVLRNLLRLAELDVRDLFDKDGKLRPVCDLPGELARTISGFEVTFDGEGKAVLAKVKLESRSRALELLGKHLKMWTEKIELDHRMTLTVVDPYAKPPEGSDG